MFRTVFLKTLHDHRRGLFGWSVAIAFLVIGALDQFALIKVLSVGPGGPGDATQVISLYMYTNAFSYGKFGYASAMGVVLFFLTLTFAALTLRVTRREAIEL